ncbi:MAG: DUF362 domain-containing protein, partial [Candidatus Omnitrophota bacterium]
MNNDNPLQKKISRQAFLKFCLSGAAAFAAGGLFSRPVFSAQDTASPRVKKSIKTDKDIVVAQGSDPYRMTRKAIDAIGGMKRFVKKGDIVVVKPNIGWDRTPEQAGNTNPFVVAALVELAFEAGAKRVNVFDVTCNSPQRCYENSGIKAAAEAKGAKVYFPDDWNFVKAKFSYASPMEGWPI